MQLDSSLVEIKGVGEQLRKKYSAAGINTINDLVNYLPRRYEDYSNIQKIASIKPGIVTLKAKIIQAKGHYVRGGLHITEAVASDNSGSVRLVWFNQPYRGNSLKSGTEYYISGNFEFKARRLSIINPSVELVSDFPVSTARIIPVYREAKGLKSVEIRRLIRAVAPLIDSLPETLPDILIKERRLTSFSRAVKSMHFPASTEDLTRAKKRLAFEEVFQLTLASLLNKYELAAEHSTSIPFKEDLARQFVTSLPFELTDDQRKTTWRIYQDLEKSQPMNRLLEGDVGSGKTVVATMAALMAMEQGFQVAFMAPTELLARQHADTIYSLLKPMGLAKQVSLLVGSLPAKAKTNAHKLINSGKIRLIVGTHALISEKVNMNSLGLIIVDEQHRFGVEQRKKLAAKAGHAPHILSMTATPIPRSLALTLYGELDISLIANKPIGRKPIKTKIVRSTSRQDLYKKVDSELRAGRQVFVVCPLIEESDNLDLSSVTKVYEQIKTSFKNYKVGLLHGKLKSEEKLLAMRDFAQNKTQILVATTVIEVGVDIPNATVMIIEDAERFGLAQIHQLRGRVGRSTHQGYCYLMVDASKAPSRRLKALESSNDGFKLAEMDLEIRGPGAVYGTAQHGLLDLKVAKITDTKLIADARQAAQEFIDNKEDLLKYKYLKARVSKLRAVTNLN